MTYEDRLRHFEEGERLCPVCKEPLPAHDTWPGFHFQFCGSPDCAAKIERSRYIGPNERKCAGPDCDNFVPAGFYHPKASFLTCCGKCWIRRRTKGNRLLTCGCGCGQEFLGKAQRKPIDGKYFLSARHYGDYLHAKYVTETSGVFRDIVVEYLEGFAILHYKEQQTVRRALGPFFRFLNEEGISSLNDVEPKTITKFLAWTKKSGRRGHNLPVSYISTFFKWAIAEGHRKGGNPVVPLIHRTRVPKRKPRPLADNDLEFTWELLNERGNARLRLASAIAEEAGLRIGEICRIRLQDVDTVRRQLFVRLPNKGNEERWACFSDKTLLYYDEWMKERNPDCGHDHLLHNTRGNPCRTASLGQEFSRVLCKTTSRRKKKKNETGFDKWSTHRMRHTMASRLGRAGADVATVMRAGGWKTCEAMLNYLDIDEEQARQGYAEAMERIRNQKSTRPQKKTLSLSDLLDHFKKAS